MSTTEISSTDISKARSLLVALDAAVLEGDAPTALDAHLAYDALVHSLNGDSALGTYADERSPGLLLQKELKAAAGETPLWGQHGEFLIVVKGTPAYVEYRPTSWLHGITFHAVRNAPFISPTGFQSAFLSGTPAKDHRGQSVRDVAEALFAESLAKHKKPVYPEKVYADYAALPFVVRELGALEVAIAVGQHVVILATKQPGLVVRVQTRKGKLPLYIVATLEGTKASPQITEASYGYGDISVLTDEQVRSLNNPVKFLTVGMVSAIRAIKTPENAAF
ncbi:Uncharacterised protein [Achromobacter xylosoxidans]|jgi:hypothetical protein|uniref:hypothetical protein n=1 Tax=Achromobacter TaxID=222 RepID=UPI0006C5AAFD|nr:MULTISPECIES: hypothetical protein [Achromobacter]CAB3920369.1 hypothetical protein LMG26846_05552 [Achromobacter insuavis]CUJ32472.1 Uncharacterised protein [Achromobacter xylosoxidans]CUJ40630.1 Uncharacterised protein [Achromobacter sp. 2789STDY5608621]